MQFWSWPFKIIRPLPEGAYWGSTINGGQRNNRKWIYFFRGNAFWDFFFPGEGLLRFIFSWRRPFEIFFPGRPFEIYFFLGVASKLFFLIMSKKKFLSQKYFWIYFFILNLRFISSRGRPFEIYFFLEKGPLIVFFSISPEPSPRSLMVVSLVLDNCNFFLKVVKIRGGGTHYICSTAGEPTSRVWFWPKKCKRKGMFFFTKMQ